MKKTISILVIPFIILVIVLSVVFMCIFLLKSGTFSKTPSSECSISRNKINYSIGDSGSIGYICTYDGKECIPSFKLISGTYDDTYEIKTEFTEVPVDFDNVIVCDTNGIKEKYITFIIPDDARQGSYRLIVEFEGISETFEHVINVE